MIVRDSLMALGRCADIQVKREPMPDWIAYAILAAVVALYVHHFFRDVLTQTLNAAVDRAINQAFYRLTAHDERWYESSRQLVCDGIRRAVEAERKNGEIDRLLGR